MHELHEAYSILTTLKLYKNELNMKMTSQYKPTLNPLLSND